MTEYVCPDCLKNFANSKSHFERHINKKKPCIFKTQDLCQNNPNTNEEINIKNTNTEINIEINQDEKEYLCEYCNRNFSRKFCLDRHINGRCKEKNKCDDKNKFIQNNKNIIKQNKEIVNKQNEEIEILKKEIEELKKDNAIFKSQLVDKKSKPNINIVVNNNIVNFNNVDYNDIDKKLFINPLMDTRLYGKEIILKMIENIYINEELPKFHNIMITDKNRGYVKIYDNGKWKTDNIHTINLVLDGVITHSKTILDELNIKYVNNNKAKSRLNTSKKYVDLCDLEYLADLEDEQEQEDINNNERIKRCKDFREMVFKDTINLFHDNKNIILKPKNSKYVELD
jgi:hypothetical protein